MRPLKPKLRHVRINGTHNRYCGPGALSCIFGITTGEAAEVLRNTYGRHYIKGTYYHEMEDAVYRLGGTMLKVRAEVVDGGPRRKPTMVRFLSKRQELRKELLLLSIGNHYMTVQGNRICDNQLGTISPISKIKRYRRAKVNWIWIIRPKGETFLDLSRLPNFGVKDPAVSTVRIVW